MAAEVTVALPLIPILVAPTEPRHFDILGRRSTWPEKNGVDFIWQTSDRQWVGVQRKEFPGDLIASLEDGRLQRELVQMLRLKDRGGFGGLVLEGRPRFDGEGRVLDRYKDHFTRHRLNSFLTSIQLIYGLSYWWTEDKDTTAELVLKLAGWSASPAHRGLETRPKSVNTWGISAKVEQQSHFLQGLPAMGPVRAKAIIDHFQSLPLRWEVSEEDLRSVKGVGPQSARRWHRFLNGDIPEKYHRQIGDHPPGPTYNR